LPKTKAAKAAKKILDLLNCMRGTVSQHRSGKLNSFQQARCMSE